MDLAQLMLTAIKGKHNWTSGNTGVVYAVASPEALGWFRVYLHGAHIASIFDDGALIHMPDQTIDSSKLLQALTKRMAT